MDLCQKSDMIVDRWRRGYFGGWVMGSNMIWKFILLDIEDCILDQWRMDLCQKSDMHVDWASGEWVFLENGLWAAI